MFAIVAHMALRWALAESEEGGTLFPDERVAERHVGKGAYAGMEFLHVNARTDHQHGAAGEPDALPAHDQPVSGVQPRLRVLLRPADPRLPRARDRDATSSARSW